MPTLGLLKTLVRELATRKPIEREPEPDLVMDDPDQVAAFIRAGREDGFIVPTYLLHAAQISELIAPGQWVVDLACGPATQLAMLAKLHPEAQFIGIDLSEEMLRGARQYLREQGLNNVALVAGDITKLSFVPDHLFDVVISTLSFHHLFSFADLEAAFSEAARITKLAGNIYLTDFGRLKSQRSMAYFAFEHHKNHPELFAQDYYHSLRAAFSLDEFCLLTHRYFPNKAQVYSTFILPFMIIIRSHASGGNPQNLTVPLQQICKCMPAPQKEDLWVLLSLFRLGGLPTRLLSYISG